VGSLKEGGLSSVLPNGPMCLKIMGARLLLSISSYHPGYSETTGWHLAQTLPANPPGSKGHMLLVLPLPFLPSWFLTPTITSRCRKALAGAERCARGCIVPDNFNHGTRIVHNQIDWCTKANELLDFREKPKIWERLLIES
jgi:hypothetical protein